LLYFLVTASKQRQKWAVDFKNRVASRLTIQDLATVLLVASVLASALVVRRHIVRDAPPANAENRASDAVSAGVGSKPMAPDPSRAFKDRVCVMLGPACGPVRYVRGTLDTTANDGFYWMYDVSAFGVALLIYAIGLPSLRRFSLKGCLRWAFPKAIFGHISSFTDYKYYLSATLLDPLLSLVVAGSTSFEVQSRVAGLFTRVLGQPAHYARPGWSARLTYTVLLVIAMDLGYFIYHYFSHKVEFLWEFHKVHHAAEVLNPLSGYRLHPVDATLANFLIGGCAGVLTGAMDYLYQRPPDLVTILNTSAVLFAYNLTGILRHSHVWLSYGRVGDRILSSPAEHQIHHSCETRHLDTNFGRLLSVWDWMAGTLYLPAAKEEFGLGLRHEEHREYMSLWGCYVLPFIKAFRLLRSKYLSPSVMRPLGDELR
jgi:sterol desaturase/sphingolipid hydroxylase (fatty acid hydroxylase superfamily)